MKVYKKVSEKLIGWIASIYKFGATKDGGKTWTEVALPEEVGEGKNKIAAIHISKDTTGYLLDEKGNLYITSDSGASWDKKILDISSLNLKNGVISTSGSPHAAIKFYSESNGIIAFSSISDGAGKTWIAQTQDGGDTWSLETLDFGDRYQLTLLHITNDGKYLTISETKDTDVLELNYE
ncbi:MAG: hypothetical protein K0S47_267 [Herbinix sp.]|jgi:hypothetical protein|nr:hypothetical protein [Herbinix sp.]